MSEQLTIEDVEKRLADDWASPGTTVTAAIMRAIADAVAVLTKAKVPAELVDATVGVGHRWARCQYDEKLLLNAIRCTAAQAGEIEERIQAERSDERERCAKEAERLAKGWAISSATAPTALREFAAAIRGGRSRSPAGRPIAPQLPPGTSTRGGPVKEDEPAPPAAVDRHVQHGDAPTLTTLELSSQMRDRLTTGKASIDGKDGQAEKDDAIARRDAEWVDAIVKALDFYLAPTVHSREGTTIDTVGDMIDYVCRRGTNGEREACANLVGSFDAYSVTGAADAIKRLAKAIRARSGATTR